MINCANMFAGCDSNPALRMTTHATERLTETAFNSASAFADNILKFSQALSRSKNPQEAFAAMATLAQENTAAAITAAQRACSAFLEGFSEMGNQCAEALNAAVPAAETPVRARRRERD